MKTYQIHLIRHALTKGGIEGRYIGQTDEPLCSEGIEQLKAMQKQYDYPPCEILVSSGLKRCTETANILYPGKSAVLMRDFEECDFGEFENLTAAELAPYKEFSEWLAGGSDARPLNGESNAEFSKRVCSCFIKLVDGLIKTGTTTTAIITHGGVIMTILAAFGLPEAAMTEWLCPAGCGYTIRITPSIWSRSKKVEVICDIPREPLTEEEELSQWDYYPADNGAVETDCTLKTGSASRPINERT